MRKNKRIFLNNLKRLKKRIQEERLDKKKSFKNLLVYKMFLYEFYI